MGNSSSSRGTLGTTSTLYSLLEEWIFSDLREVGMVKGGMMSAVGRIQQPEAP